ncbi:MAG: type II toxin-antitoxin system VapC family toxin [Pirellulales bacterium]
MKCVGDASFIASLFLPDEVLRLFERHGLIAYDAAYLELAMRLSLPLASLDKPLLKATKAEGVTSTAPMFRTVI